MAIKWSGLKMDVCCQSRRADLSQPSVSPAIWSYCHRALLAEKSVNVPELHFCKAGEMTPKCFRKDERGDLALCICQTESQLLDSGAESNSWGEKREKLLLQSSSVKE